MARKRLLITGANGMLGSTLVGIFQDDYDVFSTGSAKEGLLFFENYLSFNLDEDEFSVLIDWAKPDIIIHCAALTNGNYCEQNVMEAFCINGNAINKFIKSISGETKFLYVSSDAVFPGSISMAKESDTTNAESIYGKSKELGEYFLLNSNINYAILRTTIVGYNLNPNKQGFCEWIINSVRNEIEISLFDDVLFSPITIWDFAKQTKKLFEIHEQEIYHIAGSQPCTKFDFGRELVKSLGLNDKYIKRGKITTFSGRAKRSTDQTFNVTKFEDKFDCELPNLNYTIKTLTDQYVR
jgi:dTDP-4-dehydrorhamnose reductase